MVKMTENEILLYFFLITFLIYSYAALYVSRKYGAKIVGWPTAIKTGEYTLFLLAIPQTFIIINAAIELYNNKYTFIAVLIGFIITFIGMGFNLVVRANLGKNWVPLSKTTENQTLVTKGVYSKIRHPFYLSIFIMFLGISIISGNLYGLIFFILFLISLKIRIIKEEKELILKFGDEYKKYAEKVPMLIPKLK